MKPNTPNLDEMRFDRLRRTSIFRGDRFACWQAALLGVVGAGLVGFRFAVEAVLSGASVAVYDFDVGKLENQGTQFAQAGITKVESLVAACDAVCPGRAAGLACDVRHVGVGELARLSMLVDCSDDPALAVPLTSLSNALGIPLLRLAVDGSGEAEMGRVLCSHGGAGHSCQVCTYDFRALFGRTQRTPCPGRPNQQRPATLAGGALAANIAGLGLVQAQRLITGNDLAQVVNREVVLDLTNWNLIPIERRRSAACLSGHVRWRLTRIGRSADAATFTDLFDEAERRLGSRQVTLAPFGHPLCTEAVCSCGRRKEAIGTRWAKAPVCVRCQGAMHWFQETRRPVLSRAEVEELTIGSATLAELGLPHRGAMFVARTPGERPLRLLLD